MSPQESAFVRSNGTSVTLNLGAWQSGGCPIRHFAVQYRPKYQNQWTAVPDKLDMPRGDVRGAAPLSGQGVRRHGDGPQRGRTDAGEYFFKTLHASQAGTFLFFVVVSPLDGLSWSPIVPGIWQKGDRSAVLQELRPRHTCGGVVSGSGHRHLHRGRLSPEALLDRRALEGASEKRKYDISEIETTSIKHEKSKKRFSKSQCESDIGK
ncbi:down syndrome cell adhesion molecule-like protein Dscam2 [Caerostris extrusa]|uniref:Down syndrome cell adhesion molecule-like protein Dscam2 n=1 Tax=Caerostris extrusa TaxID=172846 RepID=A0AAV4PH81_CAEEX|nr:down syndrome cell adhesion molecule-like protein Dscam2 [Caerostris extrusa]